MPCDSSFHGKISEIPLISVDNFEPYNHGAKAYFLSHTHMDHTNGLYSEVLLDALQREHAKIYATELSAAIIRFECKNERLMDFVEVLELGRTIIPLNYDNKDTYLTVTLIPAGHSLGSVMFLFHYENNAVLYTGDFRITASDVSKLGYLHDRNREPISINTMYIDTTFCNEEYTVFPKRSDSVTEILEIIDSFLKVDSNRVAICTGAKYAYEFVFNEIYRKIGHKVYVNDARWKFYRTIQNLIKGVTNSKDEQRIHLCNNRNPKYKHTTCLDVISDDIHTYMFVNLSARRWNNLESESQVLSRNGLRVDVCFSTHCSRSEIYNVIAYLNPKKVIGFPNAINVGEDVKFFDVTDVNKTVRVDKKVDRSKLKVIFDI